MARIRDCWACLLRTEKPFITHDRVVSKVFQRMLNEKYPYLLVGWNAVTHRWSLYMERHAIAGDRATQRYQLVVSRYWPMDGKREPGGWLLKWLEESDTYNGGGFTAEDMIRQHKEHDRAVREEMDGERWQKSLALEHALRTDLNLPHPKSSIGVNGTRQEVTERPSGLLVATGG